MRDKIDKILEGLDDKLSAEELENISRGILQLFENDGTGFDSRLRDFITGELSPSRAMDVRRRLEKNIFSVFAIVHGESAGTVIFEYLSQLNGSDIVCVVDSKTICYLKKQDAADDYRSADEFANLLHDQIINDIGKKIAVGIGGIAKNAVDVPHVFGQALSAFRLGRLTGGESDIYSYKELLTLKIIEDIPRETLKFYLGSLADSATLELLDDEELIGTAREFLANSLNISETARNTFLHRNAVIYRLDKIEAVTGLNIRKFSDASTFRIIMILHKLVNA